jgi:eukaryotic-like serine/threonine-protein kinase
MTSGTGTWPGGSGAGRGLPERIGHYKVTDRIGRGAMGVVYSARDERTGRPVALKVMMADLEGDKETRERFSREANVAGKMLHRNVISVYEMGEEDGRLYMVMELLDGETLGDYMKRVGQLPLEHALDLMMQVCEGLAIAHAHAIVHRDIKPGNLYVLRDGGLKILDFGVARLANSSMTASGFIVGTPDFMSPEQARGREIDQRSDVFSAGAVFYYMLSGVKPFAAPDLPAVLHRVNSENPPPLPPEQCPPGLWRILMRALAKQTADRYADMGQLLADLVRFQQEFDTETRTLAASARERAARVAALANERNVLAARVGLTAASGSPFSERLLDRFPVLDERGGEALGVVPFRRAALAEIVADLDARRGALDAEIAQMKHMGATT